MASYVIGVDIGGTNTDVVLMCEGKVSTYYKSATTKDITTGIVNAIQHVLQDKGLQPAHVKCVMIGTTHFVNAVVQRSNALQKVGVLRLSGPASTSLPPFSDIPSDLRDLVFGDYFLLSGGCEITGADIAPVNNTEVIDACAKLKTKGITEIVVCGIFSPINSAQEKSVGEIVLQQLPGARVTLGHEVGYMGLLERENAAILNASIRPLAEKTVASLHKALTDINLSASIYLTQNDGTLIDSATVMRYPVRTFASGVTNSMRGAAYLTGFRDAIVVDIGGTSSDFGALKGGFPRPASATVSVGEVRTNFSMPDVFSIALGGGSIVDLDAGIVGPVSVGHEITSKARVFGGDVLTATDIIVAHSEKHIGDRTKVANLEKTKVEKVVDLMAQKILRGIETIETGADDLPVILVGGGSILLQRKLGTRKVVTPKCYAVANAVGAAIAQVSHTIDTIISWTTESERKEQLDQITSRAINGVIASGGLQSTASIIEVENIPVSYTTGNVVRVRVKAAADLYETKHGQGTDEFEDNSATSDFSKVSDTSDLSSAKQHNFEEPNSEHVYQPTVIGDQWILTEQDIDFISIGASILGAGGGGTTYRGAVEAKKLIREGKKIVVIPHENIAKGQVVIPCGAVGAPAVSEEKFPNKDQLTNIIKALEQVTKKSASAILIAELGGSNSMFPLIAGAVSGLPVIDGDLMGRAFPGVNMMTSFIYGLPCYPVALADEKGNDVVFTGITNFSWLETLIRTNCVAMGSSAVIALPPIDGEDLQRVIIPHGVSKAWTLGKAVTEAKQKKVSPVERMVTLENGKHLFSGKIIDLNQSTVGGFTRGVIKIQGLDAFSGDMLHIAFQNENLIAYLISTSEGKTTEKAVAVVPDIISVVDSDSGTNIHTEQLRYGLRVSVVVFPAAPILTTPIALHVIGPKAFGYHDVEYSPVGVFTNTVPIYKQNVLLSEKKIK